MNFKEFFLGEERRKTGVYVSGIFDSITDDKLSAWTHEQELPTDVEILPKKDYHTTILYSRKNIPKEYWINKDVSYPCEPKQFRIFPYDKGTKCVVLELSAPTLIAIHKELIDAGGTHDYPDFIPHVTLFRMNNEFDISNLKLPRFKLIIDRIRSKDLDLNWASK